MIKKIGLIESKISIYIGNGSAWTMFGVLSLFDNIVCTSLSIFFLLCGIVALILGMLSKEADDEMSIHNLMMAKSTTMDCFRIIILAVLTIASIFALFNVNLLSIKTVIPVVYGVSEIMIGALFLKYERDGE